MSGEIHKNNFNIDCTLVVKGVAIILLLWHHISRAYFSDAGFLADLGMIFKVCVCVFLLLSGYGLSASFQRFQGDSVEFVVKHLKKLMSKFWIVYITFLPINIISGRSLGQIYGTRRWDNMLIDFMGLNHIFHTPTLTGVWWYMGATIVLYILFPYLNRILKKNVNYFVCMNLIVAIAVGIAWHSIIQSHNPILFYLFPFSMGMMLQKTELLNKILSLIEKNRIYIIFVSILMILFGILRWKIGNEIDTLFGICIIIFVTSVFKEGLVLTKVLKIIGKYSGEIFMLHSFVYAWCFKDYVYICDNLFVVIFLTLAYSMIFAIIINKLESLIYRILLQKRIFN